MPSPRSIDPVPPVLVRDSRDDDMPAVHAIYARHVEQGTASFELDAPTPDEMRRRRAAVLAHGFPYLVAELDGRVAGYAYVNYFRERPAYRFIVENSIYLDDALRGRGLGKKLMVVLLDRCTALGLRQMLAVIGDSANTGSIGLHASCGFRFAGVLRASGWKHGRWLDTVLMQRDLGLGDRQAPQDGA
ncbi:MAG: GNAT family N-acetyltransferase [Burkholderiaceae bacterium]